MNVYRSSTTMQMDAKYKAVKQSRCMTRVITALRSPINKTVSSRCDPKPGSLTGDAVQFSVGRQAFPYRIMEGLPVIRGQSVLASQHADSALCSREDP
jgi:hypothetical protein